MDTVEPATVQSTLLFVLGMHRSGTSGLTHFIHRLGAEIGQKLLEPMAGVNDEGFWEDGDSVALNERLLAADGLRWYDCDAIGSMDAADKQAIRDDAKAHLETGYAGRAITVVKDPRLCRLLPFWRGLCEECAIEPRLVYVLRHPFAVAKSLHKRDGIPHEYSILLWLIHTFEAIDAGAGLPALLLDFDRALSDPVGAAALVRERLDVALVDDSEQVQEAARIALRAELKTQDHQLDGALGFGEMAWLAESLYRQLLDFHGTDIDLERLVALREQYRSLCQRQSADIAMLRRLARELLILSGEVNRIGELHSNALCIIAERDKEIAEKNQQIETLLAEIEKQKWPLRRLIPRIIARE